MPRKLNPTGQWTFLGLSWKLMVLILCYYTCSHISLGQTWDKVELMQPGLLRILQKLLSISLNIQRVTYLWVLACNSRKRVNASTFSSFFCCFGVVGAWRLGWLLGSKGIFYYSREWFLIGSVGDEGYWS
jgi:hypothetical protein